MGGAIIDQLTKEFAATASHELFHAQRRFREMGVTPASRFSFDSPNQRAMDRVLKNKDVASRVDAQNKMGSSLDHGYAVAEEAFATTTFRHAFGLKLNESMFKGNYKVERSNPGHAKALNNGLGPIFRAVQEHLGREAAEASMLQRILSDPSRMMHFAAELGVHR